MFPNFAAAQFSKNLNNDVVYFGVEALDHGLLPFAKVRHDRVFIGIDACVPPNPLLSVSASVPPAAPSDLPKIDRAGRYLEYMRLREIIQKRAGGQLIRQAG